MKDDNVFIFYSDFIRNFCYTFIQNIYISVSIDIFSLNCYYNNYSLRNVSTWSCYSFLFFERFYFFIFRERGRERERARNINVWLPLTHPILGTCPTTQACALTGNWTGVGLQPTLNPLSYTSQGCYISLWMTRCI